VNADFLKQVTKKGTIPILNAQDVYLNHISRASYYSYMQTPIRRLSKFFNELSVVPKDFEESPL